MSVKKDSKSFKSIPLFPYKFSWNYYSKRESNLTISQWRMHFQAADSREKSSLDLLDDNCNPIKPLNVKGSPWLQYFDMSNLLYARATRSIINHTPIGEYRPRFFPREDFLCPYSMYSIETRRHILYEYSRFNKYWNPRRNTIAHFTLFLQLNSNAFSFWMIIS